MKNFIYVLLVLLVFSVTLLGQQDIEINGGYQHVSGDNGLDGFTLGTGWNPIPHFQLFLNYDGLFDHSTLNAFALTNVGSTIVNSHMQGFLTGPRYFLPGLLKGGKGRIKGHRLIPFADVGFGEISLKTELSSATLGRASNSDTAFAWALGGGVDYRIYPHFTIRGDVGFLRTHFANSGQGRIRLGATLVWSIRSRAQ